MLFEVIYTGNVKEFENYLLSKAEQELRQKGRPGIWCRVADVYARQLTIIQHNPYPSDPEDNSVPDDITPPSLKHLSMNTRYDNFYRWGIKGGETGNHRIIFAVHNFSKVILLHYFNKQYNGTIRREDIEPAESAYESYCAFDPYLY
ncbi:type II toxin-antitoxin system RelE/ParE family toxin [Geobacillus sp. E263]|jgi:hypothetical protein|uniref:type II toxin-antitoxin system RelE/ParE family toxin n=1 Tax=Geobacillus sp. E263 TaxID=391290 RepID=UPI00117A4DE1|nr:type II toxin-antitoxin system RelE/ParE family toxin [Geobacillus sp. E263]